MPGTNRGLRALRCSPLVAACVVTVASATACKTEPSSKDGTGSTSTLAAPVTASAAVPGASLCAAITPAEAAVALGVPSLKAPESTSAPPVTMCQFSDGKYPSVLTLRFEQGRTLSDIPTIRKGHDDHGQKTTDLPGLGDVAFSFSLGALNGLSFLHHGTVVMVTSEAPLSKLEALSRTLMGRI